jgi:hypothetical protein
MKVFNLFIKIFFLLEFTLFCIFFFLESYRWTIELYYLEEEERDITVRRVLKELSNFSIKKNHFIVIRNEVTVFLLYFNFFNLYIKYYL